MSYRKSVQTSANVTIRAETIDREKKRKRNRECVRAKCPSEEIERVGAWGGRMRERDGE